MTWITTSDDESNDERAVSPVIGVILMVAITVILAAVIGTFVLDLGQSAGNNAPQASLSVDTDTNADALNISHEGGDAIDSANTRLLITNESSGTTVRWDETSSSDTLSVGDTADIAMSSTATVQSGPWDTYSTATTGNGFSITKGHSYEIQIIDVESQRIIFETQVTA